MQIPLLHTSRSPGHPSTPSPHLPRHRPIPIPPPPARRRPEQAPPVHLSCRRLHRRRRGRLPPAATQRTLPAHLCQGLPRAPRGLVCGDGRPPLRRRLPIRAHHPQLSARAQPHQGAALVRGVGQLWRPGRRAGWCVRALDAVSLPHDQTLHTALVHALDDALLPTAHGGRLKGSPHTALHHVFTTFGNGVRWVVRGRWHRCRDTVPLSALRAAAGRHLAHDPRGLALVNAALQVPVNHARKGGALAQPLESGVPRTWVCACHRHTAIPQ